MYKYISKSNKDGIMSVSHHDMYVHVRDIYVQHYQIYVIRTQDFVRVLGDVQYGLSEIQSTKTTR